jgi:hypothetical protein
VLLTYAVQYLTKPICGGLFHASFALAHELSARDVGIFRFQTTNNAFHGHVHSSYDWSM